MKHSLLTSDFQGEEWGIITCHSDISSWLWCFFKHILFIGKELKIVLRKFISILLCTKKKLEILFSVWFYEGQQYFFVEFVVLQSWQSNWKNKNRKRRNQNFVVIPFCPFSTILIALKIDFPSFCYLDYLLCLTTFAARSFWYKVHELLIFKYLTVSWKYYRTGMKLFERSNNVHETIWINEKLYKDIVSMIYWLMCLLN